MMKLQIAVLCAVATIVGFADAQEEDPNEFWVANDELTGDLKKPVVHANEEGEKCWAIKDVQIQLDHEAGLMPHFCDYDDPTVKCCTTTHDIFIKNYVQDGELWPTECARKTYDGLKDLACLACHPK